MENEVLMENILITGGAGFIGSNFIRYLLKVSKPEGKVVNLDALTYAGSLENLKDLPHYDNYFFIKGDICDAQMVEDLINQFEIDTIVHFAAETHVDRSITGPARFIQTNVIGTFNLLEKARKSWLEEKRQPGKTVHFHHISTDEVFGSLGPSDPPFCENTSYSPNSPYSASKAASDHLVRAYYKTYGLPITITNCSNNYGPNQFPEKYIPLIILNAIEGRALPVYGDGNQIRDWLYVEDHCDAIWCVLSRGRTGETYVIGGNNQPTNLDVAGMVANILDKVLPESPFIPHGSLIQFVKDRPGHDRRYAMDIRKIRNELNWQPKETLESGLRKTVEWYLANRDWAKSIQASTEYQNWLGLNYGKREVKS
jgi:dTDP-glucose 4,6-dehydratase